MVIKLTVFLSVLALSAASGVVAPARVAVPAVAATPVLAKVADDTFDPNPSYSFAYDVQDALTGDSKGHIESRANGIVQGQYNVAEPDGTRRIVDYTADPVNGFNALVRKSPLVAAAPVVAAPASPVIAARAAPVVAAPAAQLVKAPIVAQASPYVAQTARFVAQPAPVVAQSAPLIAQATPYVAQTARFVAQPAPVVAQTAPLIAQAAPYLAARGFAVAAAPYFSAPYTYNVV